MVGENTFNAINIKSKISFAINFTLNGEKSLMKSCKHVDS